MGQDGHARLTPPWAVPDFEIRESPSADGLDFFISYAREDLDVARWIAEQLRAVDKTVRYQPPPFMVILTGAYLNSEKCP